MAASAYHAENLEVENLVFIHIALLDTHVFV